MGPILGRIVAGTMAAAGALTLMSCANTEAPATFAATGTVTGEADQASADSGVCTIGTTRLAPNDSMGIYGARTGAVARSALKVQSIDQYPDGTGTCRYTAHFDAVPANQPSYRLRVGDNFVEQSYTASELENGATYVVEDTAP